jgi:multicomponent K+:H+ antiporter subunit G
MGVLEWVLAAIVLAGSIFVLLGSVALLRLPDFYTRLHGPTKATTLGLGALVIASVVFFSWQAQTLKLQTLLIGIFIVLSAPVTAYMLIKVGMHLKLKVMANSGKPPAV